MDEMSTPGFAKSFVKSVATKIILTNGTDILIKRYRFKRYRFKR